MTPIRLAYVTHYEKIHDVQFLNAFEARDDIEVVAIFLTPKIPSEIPKYKKTKLISLYHPLFPVDDADRNEYPWRTKIRIRLGQRYYARRLRKIFQDENIDVAQGGWVQTDGIIVARTGFKPLVLQPVGSDILINPNRNRKTMTITREAILAASFIACDAETVKQRILEMAPSFPPRHFFVMPWGVELKRFYPANPGDISRPMRLIMTRNFWPVYNVPFFIDVVSKLVHDFPNLEICLIGDGPDRTEIQKRISNYGLEKQVKLLGFVQSEQIASELRRSTLYVSTSLSDGTSVSLIEAMASGLPCAVSHLPANNEWVQEGENGVLLNPKDVDRSAQKIASLLRDPETLVRFGRQSLKIAQERADWTKNIERLVEIYRQLSKEGFRT